MEAPQGALHAHWARPGQGGGGEGQPGGIIGQLAFRGVGGDPHLRLGEPVGAGDGALDVWQVTELEKRPGGELV